MGTVIVVFFAIVVMICFYKGVCNFFEYYIKNEAEVPLNENIEKEIKKNTLEIDRLNKEERAERKKIIKENYTHYLKSVEEERLKLQEQIKRNNILAQKRRKEDRRKKDDTFDDIAESVIMSSEIFSTTSTQEDESAKIFNNTPDGSFGGGGSTGSWESSDSSTSSSSD